MDATHVRVVLGIIDDFFRDKSTFCELIFGSQGQSDYTIGELKTIATLVLVLLICYGLGKAAKGSNHYMECKQKSCCYLGTNWADTNLAPLFFPSLYHCRDWLKVALYISFVDWKYSYQKENKTSVSNTFSLIKSPASYGLPI